MVEQVATSPRFAMRGVSKSYGPTVALADVHLEVGRGEVCALVGQNGAGKSTLMGILAGAIEPDRGTMTLDGVRYAPSSPLDARAAGVVMIHQGLSLAPHLNVMENIALGAEPSRYGIVDRTRMRETASKALAELGHPGLDPETVVGDLSPAIQQMVEVARAVAADARVLVLDEPTSSLGHDDVQRLFALVARLRSQGQAIVYISHFLEEVKQVSDRFVILRDGRNAGEGATRDVDARTMAAMMVGRDVQAMYPRSPRVAGEAALECRGLEPGGASFVLRRGEVLGIAGLVGSGRTRLVRSIFGLGPVQAGQVRVGAYSGAAGPDARWRQGMGMVSEDRGGEGLAAALSIADNLTMSRLDGLGPGPLVFPSRRSAVTRTWIDRLGIRAAGPAQPIEALSGGNQQKVAVARLLYHDVDVLLLDEPTRGIDVASKAQIYALVDAVVGGRAADASSEAPVAPRKAVLLISSYLPELLGVCDRIAVMCRGTLGAARDVSEWTEHDLLMAASGANAS